MEEFSPCQNILNGKQGCPIFRHNIPKKYQITIKYTKWPQNIPNGHKIYQMATKYTKWPQNIPNGHKIYQMAVKWTKMAIIFS
jgi:hypothetical protein